jgi:N-acetylmuramoyl-L-alanine amidase
MTARHGIVLAALALTCASAAAFADGGAPDATTLLSVRTWTSPLGTRIVLDFSRPVVPVMPDSGRSRGLVISIPGETIAQPDSVPSSLAVRDGVIDSAQVVRGPEGLRLLVWFADTLSFHAFALMPAEDRPFRIVLDAERPGAAAAEAQRLAALAAQKRRERLRIVTIDAGHGGEDSGARAPRPYRTVLEKNVTLAVAKALADELNKVPGVKAVLTRDGDYFIPLRERYQVAERAKADLFVSIHCNSSRRRGAGRGTEVYFLSMKGANDQADTDLADVENAADHVGGVPPQAEDDVVNILYDVKRSDALTRSQLLAESILEHVAADRKLEVRGVKQAGFAVLKSVEFPSVLVETAFINNPVEAKLLRDPVFQKQIARQIATGVRAYFDRAGIGLGAGASDSPAPSRPQ